MMLPLLEGSTLQPCVAPSAYPPAFPEALASGPIPPPGPCAGPAAPSWRGTGGYFVPDRRLSPGLGWRFSPGSAGGNAGCCGAARPDSLLKESAHDPCPFGPSLSTCFGWFGLTTIQARLHRTVIHSRLSWAGFPVRFRVTAGCPMHCPAWIVRSRGVGHAVTGSPPGWEL